jgi:hypothetical protein
MMLGLPNAPLKMKSSLLGVVKEVLVKEWGSKISQKTLYCAALSVAIC